MTGIGQAGAPLSGVRVLEFAGLGSAPFATMMLADMGADVIRIDRADGIRGSLPIPTHADILRRGRRSIAIDLKHPRASEIVLPLVKDADALVEGFRPGVMERLGLGPDPCLAMNPRLVYGRATGWGQTGPMAEKVGHDINYIAVGGILAHVGRKDAPPTVPLALAGDFGGGGMVLAFGLVCALFEAMRSECGQVVDAAMIDGASLLMSAVWGMSAAGIFDQAARGGNMVDSGSPYYDTYRCRDGRYLAVGAIEPKFYREFLDGLGLDSEHYLAHQLDREHWPQAKHDIQQVVRMRDLAEWCLLFEHRDACVSPVLTMAEAARHPHALARESFVDVAGIVQPAPAPRLTRTPAVPVRPVEPGGTSTRTILSELGFGDDAIAEFIVDDVVTEPQQRG